MSIRNTRAWWSHNSCTKIIHTRTYTFAESSLLARRESMIPEEKHTFFPGNEITRNRIQDPGPNLFLPDSIPMILWDILIFFCTFFLSLSIPISISYFYDPPEGVYLFISFIFLLDIFVSLNTSYYERGKTITNRSKIILNYIKKWLIIDLFTFVPYEVFIGPSKGNLYPFYLDQDFTRLFLLLKLLKICKTRQFVVRAMTFSTDSPFFTGIKVFNNIVSVVVPLHWMNCIFNVFYCLNLDSNYLYWPDVRIDMRSRYLIIFQRVMQTLTSVGYGDFVVRSAYERLLILIFMVFTSGFFGYFIGQIELIIQNSSKVTLYFRTIKTLFLQYSERNRLPRSLRFKINSYIRYLMHTYRNQLVQDEDIINILSTPLREQVFLFSKGYIVYSVNFFFDLSGPCKRVFGYKLQLRVFGPSDIIFNEGELTDELYFIGQGSVSIVHQKTLTIFTELGKEDAFGEIAFWKNTPRTATAKSTAFSELYSLSRYDCDSILSKMPKDQEKFHITCRNIHNYGLSIIGVVCYLCSSPTHIARNCDSFICKPEINKSKFYSKEKRVNPEYTPRRQVRIEKAEVLRRYGIINTQGCKNPEREKMFKDNKYLIRKSREYESQNFLKSDNFMRVMRFVDEGKSAADSSEESERNCTKCLLYDSIFNHTYSAKSPIPSISISFANSERSANE